MVILNEVKKLKIIHDTDSHRNNLFFTIFRCTCSPIQQTNAGCTTSLDLTNQVNSSNMNYMQLQIINDGHDKKRNRNLSFYRRQLTS